ncbi:MAG: Crp/Fnr family transcriptional regulator [Anaerolineales bacterium]
MTVIEQTSRLLRDLPLFSDVPEAEINRLAGYCHVSHLGKDGVIFTQGDPCDRVWIVDAGRVKIVYQEEDGREVIIELISPGEAFGGGVLLFLTQPATAKAMEDATLVSLPTETYTQFLTTQPKVTLKLLRMLGLRHLTLLKGQALAGERVERRMAHILLKLAERCGKPTEAGTRITLSLSRQDLADMSGTTLETAIRTISRFTHDGLMMTERGGYITLLNEVRLRTLAQ